VQPNTLAQNELDWFERHDLKGIDLFRHLHGANLAAKQIPERPLTAIAVNSGTEVRVKPTATRSMTKCKAPKRPTQRPCIAG
jgi:hypothetical protein